MGAPVGFAAEGADDDAVVPALFVPELPHPAANKTIAVIAPVALTRDRSRLLPMKILPH
jgi:hypothetical protein